MLDFTDGAKEILKQVGTNDFTVEAVNFAQLLFSLSEDYMKLKEDNSEAGLKAMNDWASKFFLIMVPKQEDLNAKYESMTGARFTRFPKDTVN